MMALGNCFWPTSLICLRFAICKMEMPLATFLFPFVLKLMSGTTIEHTLASHFNPELAPMAVLWAALGLSHSHPRKLELKAGSTRLGH